jgi:hypothetical protein
MFNFIDDLPSDVLGVEVVGKITHEDYRDRLIPKAEAMMALGPIKLLFLVRSDMADIEFEALWDEQKFELAHGNAISHIAVVTDHGWMRTLVNLFAPLTPIKLRAYPIAALPDAETWLALPQ